MILECRNVSKSYTRNQDKLPILEDINFCIYEGDSLSIVGPSGSGKTTLLALCAGLDDPTTGEVYFDGHVLAQLNERERSRIRNQRIGFIFQSFHLIPSLTALENVMVPMEIAGAIDVATRAMEWLDRVGLAERSTHLPSQMSGGEQQRVAIARAFANTPPILFADEPTGNLDDTTSHRIEDLLFQLNRESGTALVLVTHDLTLAARTSRSVQLSGGRMLERTAT
ncbi:MAG: ABC transporter ATP-binding protein [Acidobacteria bacterium]|nr:ABC transporter ATP-binding protein [Acidobacteriota bacterium]